MPGLLWDMVGSEVLNEQIPPPFTLADNKIVVTGDVLRLAKLNDDLDNWSPTGKYYQSSAIFPLIKSESLTEVFGFWADYDEEEFEENDGSVGFRISSDNGVTWYGWNGSAWVIGGSFVSREVADANISSLPIDAAREFRVDVRITPSSGGTYTPSVLRVCIFVEMEFDFTEDLERSLAKFCRDKIRVRLRWQESLVGASSATIPDGATIHEPVKVYNLTNDVGRFTNLFSSLVGRVVNFTGPQTGIVLIEYAGQIPVHIETDEDYQIADRMAVIVRTPTVVEATVMRDDGPLIEKMLGGRNLGWGDHTFARVRPQRTWFDCSVVLSCFSTKPKGGKRDSAVMADAIIKALERHSDKWKDRFLSRATGDAFQVLDKTPVTIGDIVGEKVFIRDVTLDVGGYNWLGEAEIKQLVETVVTTVETYDGDK